LSNRQDSIDELSTGRAPLHGITVLDLSRAMAGPFCTMMLADMGANVIKVEPPSGDETRAWGPPFIGKESTYYLSINRNKKSIVVDLRKEKGVEIIKRMALKSQVVVENYRPGTTEKLGIDYESLKKVNPALVYCSISGFGQTGPYKERPGYDIVALAMSGMMSITGELGRPPVKMGVPVSDICAGMYAAYSIVSSLYKMEINAGNQDGRNGTHIDVSMLEGQISWLTHQASGYFATGINPQPTGSSHPSIAPYQAFRGSDGNYFIVAVGNDDLWRKFCDCLEANDLRDDSRFSSNPSRVNNRTELEQELSTTFSKDVAENWVRKISEAGVPCCPINKLDNVFEDPHVIYRRMVLEIDHPTAGKIKQLGIPYHFDDYEFSIRSPPPLLGENTDSILTNLGYSGLEMKHLRAEQVVR
jgi:crotonobetainyl-CoA:carnitine CoA-transferase CaiB-like acyl-CoA transferase